MEFDVSISVRDGYKPAAKSSHTRIVVRDERFVPELTGAVDDCLSDVLRQVKERQQEKDREQAERDAAEGAF